MPYSAVFYNSLKKKKKKNPYCFLVIYVYVIALYCTGLILYNTQLYKMFTTYKCLLYASVQLWQNIAELVQNTGTPMVQNTELVQM